MRTRLAFYIITLFMGLGALRAEPVRSEHVEAELVSTVESVRPGEPFWMALRLKMDPHWHTYWVNPGDAGLVTEIKWKEAPEGMKISGFVWPTPKLFDQAGIINYVYEDETYLLMKATPPASLKPGDTLTLEARADWLECDDSMCLPGGVDLSLELPVKDEPPVDGQYSSIIDTFRQKHLPKMSNDWAASASVDDSTVTLTLVPQGDAIGHELGEVYFFSSNAYISAGAEQTVTRDDDGVVTITMQLDEYYSGPQPAESLPGVVRSDNGWVPGEAFIGLEINPDLGTSAGGEQAAAGGEVSGTADSVASNTADSEASATAPSLLPLLGLAFVGGLILNLMPCVFPVIGLKIMSFVNQAGEERGKVVAHGFIYTLGVLMSFWALAGVLIALRAGGEELGWGFQLQSPGFVLALTVLLLVFGLNLSGVFEVGHSAVGVGANLTAKKGLSGSFFSGVLATVVATPCAAPFLAPALGGALTLPPVQSIVIFTVIGLGLAFPYLLLSFFPQLASKLPRPGAWMESFKQLMGFLMYATVAALIWVLAGQVASETLLIVLFSLVVASLGCWVFGRWGQPHKSSGARFTAIVIALLLIIGAPIYAWNDIRAAQQRAEQVAAAKAAGEQLDFLVWEKWSPETVEKLLAEGRPVYIDFTARWCATCQVNKRVYKDPALIGKFQQDKVVTLKADWTNHDPAITQALAKFNRSAVPFNVLYIPGESTPVTLPELLTV
ncbi:MAG: protein-disulfide reductase DsbD family protein, partial [Puniceicoccales bacterium]